jgi:ferredoxin
VTPWSIRKRIRAALGRSAPSTEETFTLTLVLPDGRAHEVRAESRYTLVMASQSLETPIATGCPDGGCGGCAVDVIDERGLAPPTDSEAKLLREKGKPGQRLACHARVTGSGARVKVLQTWSMEQTAGE